MREFMLALRAIWDCWQNGTRLSFEGDFYTHKIMTPMFIPERLSYSLPKVFLAAVGAAMDELAEEHCGPAATALSIACCRHFRLSCPGTWWRPSSISCAASAGRRA